MTDIESQLERLSGEEARSFDINALSARALQRSRRQRGTSAATAALLAVGVIALVAVGLTRAGRGPESIEAVETPDTELPREDQKIDPSGRDDLSGAIPALQVADEMLAALAAGQYEVAADLWEPPAEENLPSEESQVAWLERECGAACVQTYEIEAARLADDGRYEIFFVGQGFGRFAMWAIPTDSKVGWAIEWPFATTEDDAQYWLDELFDGDAPDRITVARPSGFELFENGESHWASRPNGDSKPTVVDGWLLEQGQGQWVHIANPAKVCNYSSLTQPVRPLSIFEWQENMWVTELAVGSSDGQSGGETENEPSSIFWFCDSFSVAGEDLYQLFDDGSGADSFNLVSDGKQITFRVTADDKTEMLREDGTLITDDWLFFPSFDGSTETVAYANFVLGSTVGTVTVRSVVSGEIVFQHELDRLIHHLDYDGRFIVILSDPNQVDPDQPSSAQRPVVLAQSRLTVIDTETGVTKHRTTPITGIWLDCTTNVPGVCSN